MMVKLRNEGLCGKFNTYRAICSSGEVVICSSGPQDDRGYKIRCDSIIDFKYDEQTVKLTEFEIAAG